MERQHDYILIDPHITSTSAMWNATKLAGKCLIYYQFSKIITNLDKLIAFAFRLSTDDTSLSASKSTFRMVILSTFFFVLLFIYFELRNIVVFFKAILSTKFGFSYLKLMYDKWIIFLIPKIYQHHHKKQTSDTSVKWSSYHKTYSQFFTMHFNKENKHPILRQWQCHRS